MLHKKLLATLLATALLLSAALPALAAPAQEDGAPPSIVSVVFSWLGKSFGLELGYDPGGDDSPATPAHTVDEPGAKLGIGVDPTGLEGGSDPDADSSPTTLSTTSDDEPGNELGIGVDPMG